jgi:hypothetical protein
MDFQTTESDNPKNHVQDVEKNISQLIELCRAEIKLVKEPKAKVLFETTAEVLSGLEKAFSDYQSENVGAWINDPNRPPLQ